MTSKRTSLFFFFLWPTVTLLIFFSSSSSVLWVHSSEGCSKKGMYFTVCYTFPSCHAKGWIFLRRQNLSYFNSKFLFLFGRFKKVWRHPLYCESCYGICICIHIFALFLMIYSDPCFNTNRLMWMKFITLTDIRKETILNGD